MAGSSLVLSCCRLLFFTIRVAFNQCLLVWMQACEVCVCVCMQVVMYELLDAWGHHGLITHVKDADRLQK